MSLSKLGAELSQLGSWGQAQDQPEKYCGRGPGWDTRYGEVYESGTHSIGREIVEYRDQFRHAFKADAAIGEDSAEDLLNIAIDAPIF